MKVLTLGMLVMGAFKQLEVDNIGSIVSLVTISVFVKGVINKIQSICISSKELKFQEIIDHLRIQRN